jgi:hypothetical protein
MGLLGLMCRQARRYFRNVFSNSLCRSIDCRQKILDQDADVLYRHIEAEGVEVYGVSWGGLCY